MIEKKTLIKTNMTNSQKDIFLMMDTSRVNSFKDTDGFIPNDHYEIEGIYRLTPYEWGCFRSGNTRLRIILCSGSSMTVEQFCQLWKSIYPN